MTDKTVPNSVPDPNEDAQVNGQGEDMTDLSTSLEAASESDWAPVVFPGHILVNEDGGSGASPPVSEPVIESTVLPPSNSKESVTNTDELIQLIQDLNHCNDALLNRVSNLEEALERSQTALQAEIERNQGLNVIPNGAVPHQVAQLLSELDIANDGLRRTTIHNEALQAELDVSQQRVAQLERECTLLQQRFHEKTSALQQAENTCRDLKARLHRQQRYTLQFKAALEKCLNMPASQGSNGTVAPSGPVEAPDGLIQPVTMPRSQQIQPWSSAGNHTHPGDASLTDLLRGLKSPGQGPLVSAPAVDSQSVPPFVPPTQKISDPEAEALLWQDLERVAETRETPASPFYADSQPDLWHGPENEPPQPVAYEAPAPVADANPEEIAFTEPSPWGAPLSNHRAETVAEPEPEALEPPAAPMVEPLEQWLPPTPAVPPGPQTPPTAQPVALPDYLQGTAPRAAAGAPSPLVYPLRSQKKRTSLASVELPNFGRPPHRRQA